MAIDRVVVNGQLISLGNLLGEGSMGQVYQVNWNGKPHAVKVYRYDEPDKIKVRPFRERKIPALVKLKLPAHFFPPLEVCYDQAGQQVGFLMEMFPKGYKNLEELYAEDFWSTQNIDPAFALQVLQGVVKYTAGVHAASCVISDLNPGNVQFSLKDPLSVIGGDVDAYQIPGFNGTEAHHDWVSPRLYNIDLTDGNTNFSTDDDWWSVHCHYIAGMTRGNHPFRASGKWFNAQRKNLPGVPERVIMGVSIFSDEAKPVGGALPITILSDDVLSYFHKTLIVNKHAKGPIPDFALNIKFEKCSTCGTSFSRKNCPVCEKPIFIPQAVSTAKIQANVIYNSKFPIASLAMYQDGMRLIVRSGSRFGIVHTDFEGNVISQKALKISLNQGTDYTVKQNNDSIVVSADEDLYLFNLEGEQITQSSTNSFIGKPVFSVGQSVYRSASTKIFSWENVSGVNTWKPLSANILPGSSWFQATGDGLLLMVYFASRHEWYYLKGFVKRPLQVQQLKPGERLIRQSVCSGKDASDKEKFVITRIIELSGGRQITYIEVCDIATGSVEHFESFELIEHAVYQNGSLIFSIDEGLVRWKLGANDASVMQGTESVVKGGDKVFLLDKKTMVTANSKTVVLLKA